MEIDPLKKRLDNTDPEDITQEEISTAINYEVENWNSKNLNIQQVIEFNLFTMDATQSTIVKYLIAHEICTLEEFSYSVNKKILTNLRERRSEVEVAVLQQRMKIDPRLIDQFGQKI